MATYTQGQIVTARTNAAYFNYIPTDEEVFEFIKLPSEKSLSYQEQENFWQACYEKHQAGKSS